MNRWGLVWILSLLLIVSVTGCSSMVSPSAPTPKAVPKTWDEIAKQAKGKTVNMYMWGGDDSINRYIDEWVAPR